MVQVRINVVLWVYTNSQKQVHLELKFTTFAITVNDQMCFDEDKKRNESCPRIQAVARRACND